MYITNLATSGNDNISEFRLLGWDGSTQSIIGQCLGTDSSVTTTDPNAVIWRANRATGILRFDTGGNNERMRITRTGQVCIGTSSGSGIFNVNGVVYLYNQASGAGNSTVKYNTITGLVSIDTSSIRYKDNVRDSKYGLSDLMKLSSKMFEYKDSGRTDVGFIAEEVFEIIPEFVAVNKDGQPESVAYDRITSLLVKAIQEQQVQIEELKAKLK
jgi:hypothetical protein